MYFGFEPSYKPRGCKLCNKTGISTNHHTGVDENCSCQLGKWNELQEEVSCRQMTWSDAARILLFMYMEAREDTAELMRIKCSLKSFIEKMESGK